MSARLLHSLAAQMGNSMILDSYLKETLEIQMLKSVSLHQTRL
jgi:hypothetical protein